MVFYLLIQFELVCCVSGETFYRGTETYHRGPKDWGGGQKEKILVVAVIKVQLSENIYIKAIVVSDEFSVFLCFTSAKITACSITFGFLRIRLLSLYFA